jgi:hypothetical protein
MATTNNKATDTMKIVVLLLIRKKLKQQSRQQEKPTYRAHRADLYIFVALLLRKKNIIEKHRNTTKMNVSVKYN